MGETLLVLLVIRGLWGLKRKEKLIERNKHCSKASKCHSSDGIGAGVRPLNIKSY